MPQNPAVRIIAFAALLLAVAVVVLAYTPWGQSLWQGKVAQEMGAAAIGGPFKLTDQNGKPRSDADFRGEYTLVFFGYTNCPDVCPTTLQTLTDAMTDLGPKAEKVTPVFITVDPERDTAKALKDYAANFTPRLVMLTGSPADIASGGQGIPGLLCQGGGGAELRHGPYGADLSHGSGRDLCHPLRPAGNRR